MNNPTLYSTAPSYYIYYYNLIDSNNLIDELKRNKEECIAFIDSIPEDRFHFAYSPGKWSLSQVFRHIIETERVFAYRALRFSRFDETPLAGFNENDYIEKLNSVDFNKGRIKSEFMAVRDSSISLFEPMTSEMLGFMGSANGLAVNAEMLGFMIVGHTIHHMDVIDNRYLV
jgi:hypothetical protein